MHAIAGAVDTPDDDDRFPYLFNHKSLDKRRKQLRNYSTAAEAVLWRYLHKRQLLGKKFRRQFSIGPYIVDFYCPECRVIVELDGAGHFGPLANERDAERAAFLERYGMKILRFENRLVFENLEGVLETIRQAVQMRH
jgi:very-short-patch-repair endonuclease